MSDYFKQRQPVSDCNLVRLYIDRNTFNRREFIDELLQFVDDYRALKQKYGIDIFESCYFNDADYFTFIFEAKRYETEEECKKRIQIETVVREHFEQEKKTKQQNAQDQRDIETINAAIILAKRNKILADKLKKSLSE